MLNLYTVSTKNEASVSSLTEGERLSVYYHNIFDFPLSLQDLIKWKASDDPLYIKEYAVSQKSGYFYVDGGDGLIYKRVLRERISDKKLTLAKKASKVISVLPTIKMVAVTGSLAMRNSSSESDIDLMVVTKSGSLWLTRILTYALLKLVGLPVRKPGDPKEKDRLCLNIWLDEKDLTWKKSSQNIYTAHEIAQVAPLLNRNKTYERFLNSNKWILGFWPNAVKIAKVKKTNFKKSISDWVIAPLEEFAYKFQVDHMRGKRTREVVTRTRALFHPQNWGSVILTRLSS